MGNSSRVSIRVRYEFLPRTETLNRVIFNDRIMFGKNSWARAGDTPIWIEGVVTHFLLYKCKFIYGVFFGGGSKTQ